VVVKGLHLLIILNSCPIALQQGRYVYRHDQVLLSLLVDIEEYCDDANVFADLDNYRAGNTPLATIPPSILTTSYRPDIVIFNAERRDIIRVLELTCPFNSLEHLQAAIKALQKTIQQSTAACHAILDKAAQKAIDSSQRIFLARDCVDWNV